MGYIGEEGRVVSSNYLFNMLQDLYTKIKVLLSNKADKDHTHDFVASDADTVDGYHADAFQKNISIHSKIDLKSGSFYDCILGKINEGFRGGKIEINDYCPSDTCNGNYWGFVEWTCNENRFAHLVFYTDRWEVIYIREISFNEETDTGWQRIGEGCNADTLDGYHADSFAKLSGAYFSGNVTIHSADLNGKYNGLLVGDDCYIGDCNITNTIGLMGTTNNDIAYMKFGKNGKQLGFNGSNLIYDDSIVVTEKTGTSLSTKCLKSTGFGDTNFTYYQTAEEFDGRSGWCHYLISNHGSGENYYHYTIGLPFWSSPIYQRQDGNPSNKSGWHKFHTTETITYGTSDLTAGSSSLTTGHIYLQYE